MALYKYRALSGQGKKSSGILDASSVQQVKEILRIQGLFPTAIELQSEEPPFFKKIFSRVSPKELILFTKQLAVLLKAGIPLLQSFELLVDQFEGTMKSIIISLKDDIKKGKSLAESMQKYPKYFDNIYIQLVKAGEATGKLELILERLTTYLEKNMEVKSRIKSAMMNPLIQLVLIFVVVIFLMLKVVPNLVKTFSSMKGELPLATKIMVSMSNFMRNHYLILFMLIGLIIGAFLLFKSSRQGKKLLDKLKLKLPIIKYFTKMNAVIEFSRTLGMLLESGVNLSQALDIVCKITKNQILADELNQAKESIIKQGKIAQYLKRTGLFPPMAIYLINTGEQSGSLDKMLLTVADTYDRDLIELTGTLTTSIDPLMKVLLAVIVGFIVAAIALPMMKVGDLVEI
jgi:type IV pilus assembly protein PilC